MVLFFSAVLLVALTGCKSHWIQKAADSLGTTTGGFSAAELQAFSALQPIDAHEHVLRVDPEFNTFIDRLNLHLLDIILVDDHDPNMNNLQTEKAAAEAFLRSANGRAALCATFDPYNIGKPNFAKSAIRGLNDDFSHGAVAVKVYKNLGMEIRDAKGNPVLPDNPALSPIYAGISAHNITMITHFADPDSAWQPRTPRCLTTPITGRILWNTCTAGPTSLQKRQSLPRVTTFCARIRNCALWGLT